MSDTVLTRESAKGYSNEPTHILRWCLPRSTAWERPRLQQMWKDSDGNVEWRNLPTVIDHDSYFEAT